MPNMKRTFRNWGGRPWWSWRARANRIERRSDSGPAYDTPGQFQAGDWSVTGITNGIRVTITGLPSDGGSPITAFQYQINGGAWASLGGTTIGSYDVTGFSSGAAVTVALRAVNAIGPGQASSAKSATPAYDPDAALKAWIGASPYADYHARKMMLANGGRGFQESTGQTAVTATADKIGLALDGAQWGGKTLDEFSTSQSELLTNPTFANNADGWSLGTGWSVVAGRVYYSGALAANQLQRTWAGANNKWYMAQLSGEHVVAPVAAARNRLNIGGTGQNVVIDAQGGAISTGPFKVSGFGYPTSVSLFRAVAISNANYQMDYYVDKYSIKEIPGAHGLNATAAQRLNMLIVGDRYTVTGDGTDDNHLTSWVFGVDNTVFIDYDVPATLSAVQVLFGLSDSGGQRIQVGFSTDGKLGWGYGAASIATASQQGTTDFRGQRCVAAISQNASGFSIFTLTGGLEKTGTGGSLNISQPARLSANNANGTAGSYSSGGWARVVPAQKGGLTLSDWQTIGPAFAAAS